MTKKASDNGSDATRTSIGAAVLLQKNRLLAERYRVVGPIGVGGMGLVYRAHDERLDVDVALKILRSESTAALERFEREIILAREVSHPNVVRIHDIGQDGDLHFITMDLVEGRSLRQQLEDDGPLDVTSAAAIAADIAEGLHAAHAKGVVHRDLKPANILLDSEGKAFISDFGVARSQHAAHLTQTGLIVGSPDYLAPEQARSEEVDGRADIYALGLLLYEMLTGKLPFSGTTIEELIAQRTFGQPRDLADSGVSVPAWMRRIVHRCLQKDPAARYQSAGELAVDLRAQATPGFRVGPRTKRTAVAVVAALASVILVLSTVKLVRDAVPATAVRLAVLPLSNDTGEQSLQWMATGLADMLETQFDQSSSVHVVENSRVLSTLADLRIDASSLTADEITQLGDLLGADRLLTGAVRSSAGQLRIDARLVGKGHGMRAISAQSKADAPLGLLDSLAQEIRDTLAIPKSVDSAVVFSGSVPALEAYTEGRAALRRGDIAAATPALESAVAADPGFGLAWFHLAESYDRAGRAADAVDAVARAITETDGVTTRTGLQARALQSALAGNFENSRALLHQLVESFPSDIAARVALAEAYGDEGRFADAGEILSEVVERDPNHPRAWFLLGKYAIQSGESRRAIDEYLVRDLVVQNRLASTRGRANAYNAIGIAYGRMGQLDEARENYDRAAQLRREIGDQRGVATSLNNLARLEMMAGNFDAARTSLEQARQVSIELGDQAGLAAFTNTLGTVDEEAGDYASALAHFRDALKIREELGDRRALTESYNNVGFAYYVLGELDNARIYWERALGEARELGNPDGEMQVLQSLGLLQTARGEWAQATKAFVDALNISRQVDYPEAEAVSLGNLGQLAATQGRYSAALSQLDEAMQILRPVGDTRGLAEFGLQRARVLSDLGLIDAAQAQLDEVESWLAETHNIEQQAEYLRLRAIMNSDEDRAALALKDAIAAADASGSVAAALRAQLTTATLALEREDFDEAIDVANITAQRADRSGFAPLRLESLRVKAQAIVARDGVAAALTELPPILNLLDKHAPYADAYEIRAFAASVLEATGETAQAQTQLRMAAAERDRVRQNIPPEALGIFDAQPVMVQLGEGVLKDVN